MLRRSNRCDVPRFPVTTQGYAAARLHRAGEVVEKEKMSQEQLDELRGANSKDSNELEQLILTKEFADADDILEAKAEVYGCQFRLITVDGVDAGGDGFAHLEVEGLFALARTGVGPAVTRIDCDDVGVAGGPFARGRFSTGT